jgi:hypothetical protein
MKLFFSLSSLSSLSSLFITLLFIVSASLGVAGEFVVGIDDPLNAKSWHLHPIPGVENGMKDMSLCDCM